MKKYKRPFENYKEIALDLRATREILLWTTRLYGRAPYTTDILKICNKLDKLRSRLEDEMFEDWPDKANTNVFYGGGEYSLDVIKRRDYVYAAFKGKEEERNESPD